MFPVANDFAAIAKRLKKMKQEVAAEAAERSSREAGAERQPESRRVCEDIAACG